MSDNPFDDLNSTDLLENKLRQFRALADMNKQIYTAKDITQLLRILVEKAVQGVNLERFLIYLLDEEEKYLRCAAWIDHVKKEKASVIKKRVGFRMDEKAVEVLAVRMGKSLYVENTREDNRVSRKLLKATDIREYCVVPLVGRNKVLGVLTGDKYYTNKSILPQDIDDLNLFAGHISLALENAMLYEEKDKFNKLLEKRVEERTSQLASTNQELSDKMKELTILYEMSKLLNRSLDLNTVVHQILIMVGKLGYPIASINLLKEGKYALLAQTGLGRAYEKLNHPPLSENGLANLLELGHPFPILDLMNDPISISFREYFAKKAIRSCLIVPIVGRDGTIGAIWVYSKEPHSFGEEENKFFLSFGQQAAVAMENAIRFQSIVEERNHISNISKKIEQENIYLKNRISSKFVVGKSSAMNKVMDLVRKVAPTSTSVIIYGETGTGKELIANAVHELSPRCTGSFIKVNCAAIPEELIESELFGHEKGAFTSACERRIGMFELADGGTIFLDEIGDLSMKTQTKLLRVLQEEEVQRIGSKAPIHLDVRVIAATNSNLMKRMEETDFRPDLFYRLNVFPITLPPLRERKEDLPELVDFFLNKYAHIKRKKVNVDNEAMTALINYRWPGNVRELENIVERLIILSKNGIINSGDLPLELYRDNSSNELTKPLREAVFEFKRETVIQTLAKVRGKKSHAAEILGMPPSNFSRLLKILDIQ